MTQSDQDQNNKRKHIDHLSGIETTGHEWDGLKELNNPLPRWWVWIFLVTVIWAGWYMIVYPSWPTWSGATKGTGGYTQFKELAESQKEIMDHQSAYLLRFETATFEQIMNDPELYAFAVAGGASAFKDNCATCHGTGGEGRKGYPNLNDDDWLWGGSLSAIHTTLLHGIRAGNDDTRISLMPAFGKDGTLKHDEIEVVIDYILTLSGKKPAESYLQGQTLFQKNCASCHGTDGKGDREFGAPNLTDAIWLYGDDRKAIYETIYYARAGVMPAWKERLDTQTLRQLSVYLHELGGGEPEPIKEVQENNDQQPTAPNLLP